jgi:hypothetical protein
VNVVAPEQVIGNDRPFRVNDGNDPLEREPLVALDV